MTERKRNTKLSLSEEDAPVEWPDEVWERAQISVGGKVVRPATGTLTRRGRPPVGDEPKQQVTLRLAPGVIRYFKAGGAGWQTRIGEVLERHARGATGEKGRSSSVAEARSDYMPGKRTHIEPKGDDRYIRRDDKGRITESDDVGRSLKEDREKQTKTTVKPGYGDKGDQKRKS
jgi:uncharacterized protein (DUF4415 family)